MGRTGPIHRRVALAATAVMLAAAISSVAAEEPPEPRVSRYDIATRGDLLLSQLLSPSMLGDVAEWSKAALGGLPGQVGDWVSKFLDANAMAGVITEAFPIEGQPALKSLDGLVANCARVLGVDKPAVHVRESHLARAYSVHSGDRDYLVLTSRLLELFEGRPDELRFVVGSELGHILCGYSGLKAKGYGTLSAIQLIDVSSVPDRFLAVVPTLVQGRLFTWCREMEKAAHLDELGAFSSGSPDVAQPRPGGTARWSSVPASILPRFADPRKAVGSIGRADRTWPRISHPS